MFVQVSECLKPSVVSSFCQTIQTVSNYRENSFEILIGSWDPLLTPTCLKRLTSTKIPPNPSPLLGKVKPNKCSLAKPSPHTSIHKRLKVKCSPWCFIPPGKIKEGLYKILWWYQEHLEETERPMWRGDSHLCRGKHGLLGGFVRRQEVCIIDSMVFQRLLGPHFVFRTVQSGHGLNTLCSVT